MSGSIGVLGHEPGLEFARQNLVALTDRFARRYDLAGFALLLFAALHAAVTDSVDRGSVVRTAVGVAALVLMALHARSVHRAIPPGPRLHVLGAGGADRCWSPRPCSPSASP